MIFMNLQSLVLWLHRWVGLVAGLLILVLAGTGAIMAFAEEMEYATSPAPNRKGHPAHDPIPLEELVARVVAQSPGKRILGIRLPSHADASVKVVTSDRRTFYLDPGTGDILTIQSVNSGVMQAITELHLNLMLRKTGSWVVRVGTLLTLLLALTGLWIWWPRKVFGFRRGSNWRRFTFDLHKVAGLYSSGFLVIVTLTGTTMAFGKTADGMIRKWTGAPAPAAPPQSGRAPGAEPILLSQIVQRAKSALLGASVVSFGMPVSRRAPFRVQMKFPEDHTPGGRSLVFLDQFSGEVLQVESTRGVHPGNWYVAFQHSLHTGEIFGLPSKILASLVCIALGLQVLSGFAMWWRPKPSRPRPGREGISGAVDCGSVRLPN